MNILFITQFFYPDIQATSRIFLELCEDLARKNRVCVVCGQPLIEVRRRKTKVPRKETRGGVHISRVLSARNVRKNMLGRMINHSSYVFFAFFYLFSRRKIDMVIFSSDNPLNFILAGMFRGVPRIYLCQDLYLEQGVGAGVVKKGLLSKALGFCQMRSFGIANMIIPIGERMAVYLKDRLKISPKKITVIMNWADAEKILPRDQTNRFSIKHGFNGKFVVLHSGRMGVTQDIEIILKCAAELKDNSDIVFLLVGEGVQRSKLKKKRDELGLNNVRFMHYQKEEDLNDLLASASVSVILYREKLIHSLVPSRLFTFMASARPVIAAVDRESSVDHIIRDAGCGKVIEIGDLAGLKKAVLEAYNDREKAAFMGECGRDYLKRHFSRNLMTEKYVKTLGEVARVYSMKRGAL